MQLIRGGIFTFIDWKCAHLPVASFLLMIDGISFQEQNKFTEAYQIFDDPRFASAWPEAAERLFMQAKYAVRELPAWRSAACLGHCIKSLHPSTAIMPRSWSTSPDVYKMKKLVCQPRFLATAYKASGLMARLEIGDALLSCASHASFDASSPKSSGLHQSAELIQILMLHCDCLAVQGRSSQECRSADHALTAGGSLQPGCSTSAAGLSAATARQQAQQ